MKPLLTLAILIAFASPIANAQNAADSLDLNESSSAYRIPLELGRDMLITCLAGGAVGGLVMRFIKPPLVTLTSAFAGTCALALIGVGAAKADAPTEDEIQSLGSN